ncbi:ABC transporter ATP-binding protein [Peptoniphilus sp. oral taxon 386]|uniref:ABC transporter ATP-binding protein n=1 Tax=Peptoniphilus sp. oral taxon 386 TaxID=652713 RepID=UPI0001DA9A89|nr:ABC transporter ATP-binding protein [Peptoniphilus sp. oral taxon 386]EFI41955.1 ABC transporter, ATP-binding protein [Peptoniphilus sp. oral taxon 386 str. F0131]
MFLLETKSLSKEFSRGGRKFRAVDGINFTLNKNEMVHIIGRSGSGKTTFLNLLSGILNPTSGEVLVEGKNLESMDDEQRSLYRNSFIGYVPQSLGTLPNLTVLDNVRMPHYLFKRDGDGIERASMLLDWMGILSLKDEFPNKLSGGEIKRVLLARALMNSPKVIIADEPTSDLDFDTTKEIMNLFSKINKESISLIIVTHEIDILKYGNRVLVMNDGKLSER